MMQWLSGWLKDLIVILLLASFIDLLLPNHSLQRYVKTVISLFLLSVMLTPVFRLFENKWDVSQLAQAALDGTTSRQSPEAAATGARPLPALDTIVKEAERKAASDRQRAQQLAERQMAEQIRAELAEAGEEVREVTVALRMDDKQRPAIANVTIRAPASRKNTASAASGGPGQPAAGLAGGQAVEPVKPVTVEIGPPAAAAAAAAKGEASSKAGEAADAAASQAARREEIRKLLQQTWSVSANKIAVVFEQG